MSFFRPVFLLFLLPCFSFCQSARDTAVLSTDIRRVKLHEDINRLQMEFNMPQLQKVDELQSSIENSAVFDHRIKIKYLTGLKYLLEDLVSGKVHRSEATALLLAYQEVKEADQAENSIEPLVKKFSYSINQSLLNDRTVFRDNPGLQRARVFLYSQFIQFQPEKILTTITPYLNESFVDNALITAANNFPAEFYNYASATETALALRMRKVKDSTVELLCRLSSDSSGRLLFPFIHCILEKELEYDSIKYVSQNNILFYKLLVKTQMHFQAEIENGNTPVEFREVEKLLKRKAEEVFVTEINALHDESDLVRFKLIEGLNPEELYYLMISTEDIIYTSSFVGIFNRMMQGLQKKSTDDLLHNIHYDGFRKFIKMAADYNKLEIFIAAMKPEKATLLLKNFAAGLESDKSLEDAVDVANAYSSISNVSYKKTIAKEVDSNLNICRKDTNEFGIRIYEALQVLLASENDSGKAFAKKYQLEAPYFMSNAKLVDEGKLVEQLFFYGDKDGMQSFQNFIFNYKRNKLWKVIQHPQWVEIKSLRGKPVYLFANIPFDNSNGDDPDARSQDSLSTYLMENQLYPTVVVHRGHSYHLKSTLLQLPSTAKIILLGSCGSYQYLSTVLDICPDAQIISSREVGSLAVNDPILNIINEQLRLGNDIDWVKIWKNLKLRLGSGTAKDRFENYVAPHKNLGSLLLKAF